MFLIAALALGLMSDPIQSPEVAGETDEARPTAAQSRNPAGMVVARGPTFSGETRTVCRREKPMNSNIPQRVCRVVAANSSERARASDQMVREMQRLPYDAERSAAGRSAGGRSVY